MQSTPQAPTGPDAIKAANARQRTFLQTFLDAYYQAYAAHFAPVGYHEIMGRFCEDLKALDARENAK